MNSRPKSHRPPPPSKSCAYILLAVSATLLLGVIALAAVLAVSPASLSPQAAYIAFALPLSVAGSLVCVYLSWLGQSHFVAG